MEGLLICSNKEDWSLINKVLHRQYPRLKLTSVKSQQEAIGLLSKETSFAIVILDLEIKNTDISMLFQSICDETGNAPVVCMGSRNFIVSKAPKDLYEANANSSIIAKPINPGDLVDAVERAFEWIKDRIEEENTVTSKKMSFLPLKIRNLYRFNKIPYDVYLELSETKFVKFLSKDEEYAEGIIQRYINKKIKFAYLERKELLSLLLENIADLNKLLKLKSITPATIMLAQVKSISLIHEHVRTIGVTKDLQELVERVVRKSMELHAGLRNFQTILKIFPFEAYDIPEQSMLVAYLCEALLDKAGYTSEIARLKLGFASTLHDCMLTNDKMAVLTSDSDNRLEVFDEDEVKEFLEHPQRAGEVAEFFPLVPELRFVVAEHHELPMKKGFPAKMSSSKVTTLSGYFILSVNFIAQFLQTKRTMQDAKDITDNFRMVFSDGNYREPMKALAQIFD